MKCKTALRIISLGVIAVLCDCNKKQTPEAPAKPPVEADAITTANPNRFKYVYGMRYDTANNPAYRAASDAEKAVAYTGKRSAYQGVWLNEEILKAFQETNSPAIAAGNGIVSDISLSRDSVRVTLIKSDSMSPLR